ncbi:MAG: hypothetical protein WCG23_09590 [bacterium]
MGNTVIQLRNETAATWTSSNPTLAQGEMGLETDTNRIKFGDGSTAWNSLPYVGAGASFKYGLYTLSADQTSNFALNNHVQFNTVQGSLGGLSTGSGQANGIITLAAGKTYKISGNILAVFSNAAGHVGCELYDRTNSTPFTPLLVSYIQPTTATANYGIQPGFIGFITPSTNIDIDLRIMSVNTLSGILSSETWLLIEEYAGY